MSKSPSEAVEAWNTVLFDKFARYRAIVSSALAPHGDRAIEVLAPGSGDRVIDLGCGFGDTTLALAKLVGDGGRVVGVDAAGRYLDVARREAGDTRVEYAVADLEREVPAGPFDLAYARFGTMFFTQPVIALRNVRAALAPGGRLCMAVWRAKSTSECLYVAEQAVRTILGSPEKGDNVTCGPGPFSMANADVVTDQLLAAGYRDVALARFDAVVKLADSLDAAVTIALDLGPAGEVVRLAGAAAVDRRADIERVVRTALEPYVRPDGVWGPTSSWIVTAGA